MGWLIWGTGCPRTTNPVVVERFGLDIDVMGGTYEVEVRSNVYLKGRVTNTQGEPMRGVRVFFSVSPPQIGNITPWSWTDPTRENGFNTTVVFYPETLGVATIKGELRQGDWVSWDTVSVLVRNPINR